MNVTSVNIGAARAMSEAKVNGKTGIYKQPVDGPVDVAHLGLPGDAVCDTKNHGGPDQAVYVYGQPDYDWWATELGESLAPGTFGENITISGLESANTSIGDRLVIGTLILEITAPRIPCHVLARRMEDNAFVKRFRAAERPGLYCRVIQTGAVQAGMPVRYEAFAGPTVTSIELYRTYYDAAPPESTLRRILAAPLAIRARGDNEAKLAKLSAK